MVDWITHLLVPWVGLTLIQLRSPRLTNRDIAVAMLGAVIPDIFAIAYLLPFLGIDAGAFLLPFHTPIGSLIVAATVSFLFSKRLRIFSLLTIGVASHFALDALLLHAAGGMALLFPFNWTLGFQLGLFPSDSWIPTLASVLGASLLFIGLKLKGRKKS